MHPLELRGWLFDLDGILTDTARIHVEAWAATFDELLGHGVQPFDPMGDYLRFVDGKPRADGVRDFLASRGVTLPEGDIGDPPERDTVHGVGRRKNERFLGMLAQQGVRPFDDAVEFVRALRGAGRRIGVVSASENCRAVLSAAGMSGLFSVVVDGQVAVSQGLAGKPAPDTYLHGAWLLGLSPGEVAVVEDAPAGVAAGRAGGFGYVVGVARRATPTELLLSGADVAVHSLGEFDELCALLACPRPAVVPA